jgi:hypothetical protein
MTRLTRLTDVRLTWIARSLAVSALLVACGTSQASLSAGPSVSPMPSTRIPNVMTCADMPTDPKCSTPPPGWTPQPAAPCDHPLGTLDEVRAATGDWHLGPGQTAPPGNVLPVGDPILVHGLRVGDADEWLVPVLDGHGGASEVIAVGVRANGRGCAGMSSGWSGPFPLISIAAARRRTAGPSDPVASIEAVHLPWTNALPPSSDTNMVWRAIRQSGHEVFLFGSGDLYDGGRVRAILGWYFQNAPLRGDPSSATPRPSPTFAPRYPVATAEQVLAGLSTDPFLIDHLRYLRAETGEPHPPVLDPRPDRPVRVTGLHKPYTVDLWLVPIRDRSANVVSVVAVSINSQDGLGSAIEARGWSGEFPAVTAAEATRLASTSGDPAVSVELGWAEEYYVSPGGVTAPGWLATRQSGARVVVTEDRAVVPEPR